MLIPQKDGKDNLDDPAVKNITLLQGGCYTVIIQRPLTNSSNHDDVLLHDHQILIKSSEPNLTVQLQLVMIVEVTPSNSIHILWLVPQFFIMTVAEVMFSVTGLQFSFTQVDLYNQFWFD